MNKLLGAWVALLAAALMSTACSDGPPEPASSNSSAQSTADEGSTPEDDAETDAASIQPVASHGGLGHFSRRRAMKTVRKLASDIGVRVRTTRGETRGAHYIADRFRALGYDVKIQRFEVDGGTSRNVVATWPSVVAAPFVIGAHMDTVSGSPGANDNASGVAVVLEMARIFAGRERVRFMEFVTFGSEEYGKNGRHHIGSEVRVARMTARRVRRTPGMLSVDMIADGRPLIAGYSGFDSDVVARDVFNKLRRAGIDMTFRVLCDCSDHGPFERAGIPAAFLWSGDEPNYHSPSDTVPNLVPEDLVRTGRGVRFYLKTFTRDLMARYRSA